MAELKTSSPLVPGTTESIAPPSPSAITGVPVAIDSTGTMPKSSTPGMSSARVRRCRSSS